MDQRGGVDELDRGGRAHEAAVARRRVLAGGEEDEHRPQPLASRGDRRQRLLGQRAVGPRRGRGEQLLDAGQPPGQRGPGGVEDRVDLGRHARFSPTCRAMIPPAVITHRSRSIPARSIMAASSGGPGKRFTLEGRYE